MGSMTIYQMCGMTLAMSGILFFVGFSSTGKRRRFLDRLYEFLVSVLILSVFEIAAMALIVPTYVSIRTPLKIDTFSIKLPTRQTPTPFPAANTTAPEVTLKQVSGVDQATLIYIPAGDFLMGSKASEQYLTSGSTSALGILALKPDQDEIPQRTVNVAAFWIAQTEVTNGQYALCVQAKACPYPKLTMAGLRRYYGNSLYGSYPVVNVNWEDARKYCEWAGGRLPSEAEWEKAARGTQGFVFPWGDAIPAKDKLNVQPGLSPVGTYTAGASPYGVLDMSGNVWEWVNDIYSGTSNHILKGPAGGPYYPYIARAAEREVPGRVEKALIGFRCAK